MGRKDACNRLLLEILSGSSESSNGKEVAEQQSRSVDVNEATARFRRVTVARVVGMKSRMPNLQKQILRASLSLAVHLCRCPDGYGGGCRAG